MRKSTLNSTGVYNRCKLTRLVVDSDWDKKVWDANWQEERRERELCERLAEQGMLEELEERREKRKEMEKPVRETNKKRKVDNEEGAVWGEQTSTSAKERNKFLYTQSGEKKLTQPTMKQSTIGKEWLQKGRRDEVARRTTQDVEQMMNGSDDVASADDSVCDVRGSVNVQGETNTSNRCDDQLLNGLKILGSENFKLKKQQCAKTTRVSHTSLIEILTNNFNSPNSQTVEISECSVLEAGSWTNHSSETSPAGEVETDQDLEKEFVDGNNGSGEILNS